MKKRWLILACVVLGLLAAGMLGWVFWPRGGAEVAGPARNETPAPAPTPAHLVGTWVDPEQQKVWEQPDTDGDGLPDAWEIAHFGNLDEAAMDDPDGDGMPNHFELHAGLNPARPDRLPDDHPNFGVHVPGSAKVHYDSRPRDGEPTAGPTTQPAEGA